MPEPSSVVFKGGLGEREEIQDGKQQGGIKRTVGRASGRLFYARNTREG